MYFFAKFCRICIQSGVKLMDLDTVDFDEVKLSEKLEVCTKMVVTRESLSTDICVHCIAKLRVSYEFNDMCKKSTKKLQGYLKALISKSKETFAPENFVNTDLSVVVTPLRDYEKYTQTTTIDSELNNVESHIHREKRKRITKEQRCSLLKRLLTNSESQRKERDKFSYETYYKSQSETNDDIKGGLRNIINFTKNYEFGVKLDKNYNYESTPLDKLKKFSYEFFRKDFTEFRNTILYIIDNKDNLYDSGDSEDEFFNTPPDEDLPSESIVKFEEVIVEPDVQIKTEVEYEEESDYSSYYGEYGDLNNVKTEITKEEENFESFPVSENSLVASQAISEDMGMSTSSMQILNNFVGNYCHKRTFSPHNARCRTRDNPYINPMLKQQFLYRSFKCHKCRRYFKSPGYLKAHYSKVH